MRRTHGFMLIELPFDGLPSGLGLGVQDRAARQGERGAFTLIELLVVIAILALLVSMLVPSLRVAVIRAKDVHCASIQRQTLAAVLIYNADFDAGLANFHPRCPWWGGWPGGKLASGTPGNHWGCNELAPPGDMTSFYHRFSEGRSGDHWWRGYLLEGRYADAPTLGCPFTDYTDRDFWSSHNRWGVLCNNHVETDGRSATLRRNPAWVWFGPGTWDALEVRAYGGGQLAGTYGRTLGTFRQRSPLLHCPQVFAVYRTGGLSEFEASHRPAWRFVQGAAVQPVAMNVGYTDGSVTFYVDEAHRYDTPIDATDLP